MSKKQEILGVIPARGGSKGLPRKNIKPFLGKPLIAWTIEEVKRSKLLTRVIVSTDDEEIAEVAKKYGADVPFLRPKEIAQSSSIDLEFFEHALNWLKENEKYVPDILLRLPPTSPLRKAEHIDEGIQKLIDTPEADAVRPIMPPEKHPYRMWKITEDKKWIEPFLSEKVTGVKDAHSQPRQSYPPVYVQTGALDVIRRDTILKLKSTTGRRIAYFLMDPEDSANIDDATDFFVAEMLMKRRLENTKS